MATATTQSITNGQIGQICDRLATKMRESGLPAEGVQNVLASPGGPVIVEMVAVLCRFVEAVSNLIVRIVRPNRKLTPRQALEATGRNLYVDDKVLNNMPRGEGEENELVFFKVGRYLSDDDLEKEYSLRGLKPADPYSLAKANQDDPTLADERPNGTHWKDSSGCWCFVAFYRWHGGRRVHCDRRYGEWHAYWWFAGFRK